ncbi:hypothetical protein J2Y86_005627 [Pseudomonas migulae]|uniref:hypothetical protein n=1 Tax=Pseudomonas migulae TaxID=78543 RepID=UPI0020A0C8BA|nr:hypothetical protein [Pseudomonas migulae]MCP1500920.1 hypothetical protein [Pseudomonas migulae]
MATDDDGSLPKTSWVLSMSDGVVALTQQDGRNVRVSVDEGRGRASSGDLCPGGGVTLGMLGKPPRGEEGTKETSGRLFQHLNASGARFTDLEHVEHIKHVDAFVCSPDGAKVSIQVVRALTDSTFWEELARSKSEEIERVVPMAEAVEMLKKSISHKQKPELDGFILALDATDVPGLSLDAVHEAFNAQYGGWVDSLGFYQVWVVGPWPEMIHQLGLSNLDC